MIGFFDRLARPVLRALDPEQAHRLTIEGLKLSARLPLACNDDARLGVTAFGLHFPNPVGMAAGFDKNAEVPDALLWLGFGFVEIGSVTPRPQTGNPRPRIFRLKMDQGVINRLGFNNEGEDAVHVRLRARGGEAGIVGVNVGANKDSADRVADYVHLIARFAPLASYLTVNISSPNTPGLRDLQDAAALDDLLARVIEARDRVAASGARKPVLVKIAPDLSLTALDALVRVVRARAPDGVIVSNTTITRPALRETETAKEQGGLSGRPLFPLATRMLAETYLRVENAFPLIGVGGIHSGESALQKIKAGATLIQLYTGMIFRGLGLVAEIKRELTAAVARQGEFSSLVGRDAKALCSQAWPQ